jgi:hypothetical protein
MPIATGEHGCQNMGNEKTRACRSPRRADFKRYFFRAKGRVCLIFIMTLILNTVLPAVVHRLAAKMVWSEYESKTAT